MTFTRGGILCAFEKKVCSAEVCEGYRWVRSLNENQVLYLLWDLQFIRFIFSKETRVEIFIPVVGLLSSFLLLSAEVPFSLGV